MEANQHPGSTVARTLRRLPAAAVHLPGESGYETMRRPWNRIFDPKPAGVVEAAGPDQVAAAIRAARELELPLAVQSTGHGVVVPADGAMLLTTSRMASVTVDTERRTVRVGGGARWGEVISAAAPYGLSPLSGPPMVGVAGYTLGGGASWLSRRYGFTADSMRRAEVVTAEGRLLTASAEEHPDLHWALRGGSGNFGVVTELELALYPVRRTGTWRSMHAFDQAAHALAFYREWAPTQPDRLSTALVLGWVPDDPSNPDPVRGKPVLAVRAFYLDGGAELRQLLAPMLAAAGPSLLEGFHDAPFATTAREVAVLSPSPVALEQDVVMFHDVPDSVLATMVTAVADRVASPLGVELRYWGGAMARPSPDAGPVGHRQLPFSVMVWAEEEVRSPAADGVAEVSAQLRAHAAGGSFLNFLSDRRWTRSAYTVENYRRLALIKRQFDPANTFRLNHNIPPADAAG